MRDANIKKAGQDEQQNQTTATTTNTNYIKNVVHFKKQKLVTKPNQRQKKLKLNKITYYSPKKISDQSIISLSNN